MSIVLERIGPGGAEAFEATYKIYAASLVAREQKPKARMMAMLGDPRYRLFAGKNDQGIVAMSVAFLDVPSGMALLEYMAVEASRRSHGIGGDVFRGTVSSVRSETPGLPMLVEVDSPDEDTPDRAVRAKRVAFYRKLGCRILRGLEYDLPLEGEGPPPRMHLMIEQPGVVAVPRNVVAGWLEAIYAGVYDKTRDDPRIAKMLGPLPITVSIY